jgi:ABC-type sugar transport system ATPase subunit
MCKEQITIPIHGKDSVMITINTPTFKEINRSELSIKKNIRKLLGPSLEFLCCIIILLILGILELEFLNRMLLFDKDLDFNMYIYILVLILTYMTNSIVKDYIIEKKILYYFVKYWSFLSKILHLKFQEDIEITLGKGTRFENIAEGKRNKQQLYGNTRAILKNTITLLVPLIWISMKDVTIGIIAMSIRIVFGIASHFYAKYTLRKSNKEFVAMLVASDYKTRTIMQDLCGLSLSDMNCIDIHKRIDDDKTKLMYKEFIVMRQWKIYKVFNLIATIVTICSIIRLLMNNNILVVSVKVIMFYSLRTLGVNIIRISNLLDNLMITFAKNAVFDEAIEKMNDRENHPKISSIHGKNIKVKKFGIITNKEKKNEFRIECKGVELEPGSIVGVIGSVGSGKTTLIIKCLTDFNPNIFGEVSIDGRLYPIQSLHPHIGIIEQRKTLSMIDTVKVSLMGSDNQDENLLKNILNRFLEIQEIKEKIGDIDIFLQKEMKEVGFSGGQEAIFLLIQTIYRAIKHHKYITILDEMDANLSEELAYNVTKIVFELLKDKIIFLITHKKAPLLLANKTIEVKDNIAVFEDKPWRETISVQDLENILNEDPVVLAAAISSKKNR